MKTSNYLCAISTFGIIGLVILFLALAFVILLLFFAPIKSYLKALFSGCYISIFRLLSLKQRGQNANEFVESYIATKKAKINFSINEIEAHIMAGGNVKNVISALVMAENSGLDLSLDLARAIDLSGTSITGAVKDAINPKVIETKEILAISKDGIEIKVKVKITLIATLTKILGGTREDTILAKISEGIVATIGALSDHNEVLQNPDLVSKSVLAKYEDRNSAYTILSIDLVDISFGRNILSQLKFDELEFEKQRANAKAEQLKHEANLKEQQMRIKAHEINMEKLRAEAEVPKKILKIFEEGNMSLLDYYKMQNLIADTNMRKAIAKSSGNPDAPDSN